MRRMGSVLAVTLLLAMSMACGQKPGVAEQAVGPGGAIIDPKTGQLIDPETGRVLGAADQLGGLGGAGGTGGGAGLAGTGGGGAGAGGGTGGNGGPALAGGDRNPDTTTDGPGPSGGGRRPLGGTDTGVTSTTITIGIHAPTTGAAPVPSQSFERGKDLYWDWLRRRGVSINGRHVEVVYRNDRYNPSAAVSACKEMVQEEKVFLLVGAAGTDQIVACAQYAASVGVPYISAGVTQLGVGGLPNYLATWLSYAEQAPLLADRLVHRWGAKNKKNAMVYFDTRYFYDARDAFVRAMRARGASVKLYAEQKTAGTGDAAAMAQQLRLDGMDNVYVLTSPTYWIQLAQAAANQGYRPHYGSVGLTMGIDTVARAACGGNDAIQGAEVLNPFPAYFNSDQYDRNFRRAGGTDDIMFGLWGTSKVLHSLLVKPGRALTRERFMYYAERSAANTGVLPPYRFSPSDHFGGTGMHLNRANCSAGRWETITHGATRNF